MTQRLPAKRLIMTGGGTAGHVTPNLALIPRLLALGHELHYVGRQAGIERELIEPTGIPYHAISAGKLRRYFDLKNVSDVFLVALGFAQSLLLVGRLRPRLLFSKGGFVSCPLVWAAWANRVPVIIHESDTTPGLANRLSMPFADRICYSFPETGDGLPPGKGVYTGIPVRETLLAGDPEAGRNVCGFADGKPVVLVMGGSQGSASMNRAIRAALGELLTRFNVCHLCGRGRMDPALEPQPGYKQFEYVTQELPDLLAAADIVVTRAGATTLSELLELRKANLLIPLSRKASRGDQILNARSFEKQGFSHVLTEDGLDAAALVDGITAVYAQRDAIALAMGAARTANGVDRVLNVIQGYVSPG